MANKSFGREYAEAVIGKAAVWAPPIVWGLALGPVGVAAGVVAACAIAEQASRGGDSGTNGSESKDTK
jgi:hypothetical protein